LSKKILSFASAWLSAARLRTLPLSVSGIMIGSSYAFFVNKFNPSLFIIALLTTVAYQVLSNFANDYGDGIKGTDDNRTGPKRAVQSGLISRSSMKKAITILSLVSIILTLCLVTLAFGAFSKHFFLFISLGSLAIFAAIKYTVGKFAYGYFGLGDLFVFVFFGIVSVLGSNFLFSSNLNWLLLNPAITLGLLSVGVLNLNNMRDLKSDEMSGKKTLAVFMGKKRSKIYHSAIISAAIILMLKFQISLEIQSIFLNIILFLNIIGLLIHLFQIYNITQPSRYDNFLKLLALHAFFYSIIISIFFFKIVF
jgi:1,4-dihydroxy-2-naphthoate octaprenyltransferase